MKKKVKTVLNLLAVCFLSGIIFIGVGYSYLNRELKPTENKTESVPYYPEAPESAGVMFDICGDRTLCYMNFEDGSLNILFDTEETAVGDTLYGYSVDYLIEGDYDLLSGIIDIAGGIEMENGEEVLRFTGVQVTDILSRTTDREELRRKIIPKIIEKIRETGFQKADFLYIIENSNTNLTVPDCYYWSDYITDLCTNARIIN